MKKKIKNFSIFNPSPTARSYLALTTWCIYPNSLFLFPMLPLHPRRLSFFFFPSPLVLFFFRWILSEVDSAEPNKAGLPVVSSCAQGAVCSKQSGGLCHCWLTNKEGSQPVTQSMFTLPLFKYMLTQFSGNHQSKQWTCVPYAPVHSGLSGSNHFVSLRLSMS